MGCEPGRSRCGRSFVHGTNGQLKVTGRVLPRTEEQFERWMDEEYSRTVKGASVRALGSNEGSPMGDCVATTGEVIDGSVTVNTSRGNTDD